MSLNPLPTPYYFIFGIYEPLSVILSCTWACFDPVEVRCFARNYKHLSETKINVGSNRHLTLKRHGPPRIPLGAQSPRT